MRERELVTDGCLRKRVKGRAAMTCGRMSAGTMRGESGKMLGRFCSLMLDVSCYRDARQAQEARSRPATQGLLTCFPRPSCFFTGCSRALGCTLAFPFCKISPRPELKD